MPLLIEKRNSEIFLRPRFTIDLNESCLNVIQNFKEALKADNCKFVGKIVDNHIFLGISPKKDHFWSPQLHLEIVELNDSNSELKGLFGPKPQVWTLFMFIHFIVGSSFLGFAVLLYTRISLEEDFTFPLIMMIFLPIIWFVLYFLGKIGKDTGKNQMKELHDFMLNVISR